MSYTEDPEVRDHYERTHVAGHWPYREVISGGGGPGCPIFYRWEILKVRGWKLMVHRFLPHAEDVDFHDHPASFLTVVLRGCYWDETPGADGLRVEEIRAPTIRWRHGTYKHRTVTRSEGAWTIVLMRPKQRDWGFWRGREWLPWGEYVQRYGAAITCPDDETGVRR